MSLRGPIITLLDVGLKKDEITDMHNTMHNTLIPNFPEC